jgi:protoporphyrinogen/coproporphyrinogen III oxidase
VSITAQRVIVVGAGVAGLAAAHRLTQQGFEVTVLEAEDYVGGKTAARRRDGFTLNTGASVLAGSYKEMLAIAEEIGVGDQIVKVAPTVGVYADDRVYWLRGNLPGALLDFVRTPLLSWRSKLLLGRLALDSFRNRKRAGFGAPELRAQLDTESVAEYCDRRLNAEIRDRLLAPLLGGLYVIDGAAMSVADMYFSFAKLLGGGMLGYRGGIDFFARALAARHDVRTGARVTLVERDGDAVTVHWELDGGSYEETVDGVVLTVPAPLVPPLYPGLDPALQGMLLEGIETANLIGARFGVSRAPDTDALVAVVPSGALNGLCAVLYEHNTSPGSAPPGKSVIGAFFYHEWSTPRLHYTDEQLLAEMLPALEQIVPGLTDSIEFAQITRWTPGALRSHPGQHRLIAEIDATIDPHERVQLAGDYLTIPSINGSVITGETAARRLTRAIREPDNNVVFLDT